MDGLFHLKSTCGFAHFDRSRFSIQDSLDADEFGLNYSTALDVNVAAERMSGRKKTKERLLVLAWAHADDSKRTPFTLLVQLGSPEYLRKGLVLN